MSRARSVVREDQATYAGLMAGEAATVSVTREAGVPTELCHDGHYAPTMSWGWGGPPSLELARALLVDAVGAEAAERHGDALREVLAHLEGRWSVSATWLAAWARALEAATP